MTVAAVPETGLWRNRDFVKLWAAKSVSDFGSQLGALELTALLLLKATPGQMGLLGAAGGAPILLVGLVAGVWVDRLRRRSVLMTADIGRAILLASVPVAALVGSLRIEHLYLVAALTGILAVFFDVADQSYLPSVVARDQLMEGNSKLAGSSEIAEITAPGMGGALAQFLSAPIGVAIDAVSFLVSAICVWRIRTPEAPPAPAHARAGMWVEIQEGLRVVLGDRVLRALAGSTATFNFAGSFIGTLYGLYVLRDLGLTPVVMGLSIGAGGLGALLGTVLAGRLARRFGVGPTLLGSLAFGACGGLALAFLGGPPPMVAGLLLAVQFTGDIAIQIYFINEVSLRQALIPAHVMGRANASMHVVVKGLGPIGALCAGALGETIGVRPTLLLAGIGLLSAVLWLVFSPVPRLHAAPPPAMLMGGDS